MHLILLIFFILPLAYLNADNVGPQDIFLSRHSGKTFDPSQNITIDQVHALVEAARWAPSSHNDQPWNFIICHRDWTPEEYLKAFSSFKDTQQRWAKDAPLYVIITARTHLLYNNKYNYWAEYDTGAAAISMALQAVRLKLMAHQVGGFNKEKIRQDFKLPNNCKPMTIMVIGYESDNPEPPAFPRERSPVGEKFFLGSWGKGIF